MEDVLELYALNDPLGVRGRLGLFYARPTFKRAREVEAAAVAVAPQRRGLEALIKPNFGLLGTRMTRCTAPPPLSLKSSKATDFVSTL